MSGSICILGRACRAEKDGPSHRRVGSPCNQGIISRHNGEEAGKLVINQILGFHEKALCPSRSSRDPASRVLIIASAALCLPASTAPPPPSQRLSTVSSKRKAPRELWAADFFEHRRPRVPRQERLHVEPPLPRLERIIIMNTETVDPTPSFQPSSLPSPRIHGVAALNHPLTTPDSMGG